MSFNDTSRIGTLVIYEETRGFTLIELSVVLVIVGLLVGGVLMGKDLVRAAEVRAQLSQIHQFDSAVNTFKVKYDGALPGDISPRLALKYGFAARGSSAGQGDGDGVIQGCASWGPCSAWPGGSAAGWFENEGETAMFWSDLTYANGMNINLIPGNFNRATIANGPGTIQGTTLGAYFPSARMGGSQSVYVTSGGPWIQGAQNQAYVATGKNYFTVSQVIQSFDGGFISWPGITVKQAYEMDAKVDDGLPQSGSVQALYVAMWTFDYTSLGWAGGPGDTHYGFDPGAPPGGQEAPAATSCYDNGNIAGATMAYSVKTNGGGGVNCALSFEFQ